MTLTAAMEYVANRVPISAYPAVPDNVFESLIADSAIYTVHAINTAYIVGKRIQPAISNGRLYKCIVAGTTSATIPNWPEPGDSRIGDVIKDGTVQWRDIGPEYPSNYDLFGAIKSIWNWKASQAAIDIDATDGGLSYRSSQIQQQCLEMAKRYARMVVE